MKKMLLWAVKILPRLIEYLPVLAAMLQMIGGKWYVKLLVILAFLAACCVFLGCNLDPYVVDLDHPIDTAGRALDVLQERGLDVLKNLGGS